MGSSSSALAIVGNPSMHDARFGTILDSAENSPTGGSALSDKASLNQAAPSSSTSEIYNCKLTLVSSSCQHSHHHSHPHSFPGQSVILYLPSLCTKSQLVLVISLPALLYSPCFPLFGHWLLSLGPLLLLAFLFLTPWTIPCPKDA